jgi:hypothetical protein
MNIIDDCVTPGRIYAFGGIFSFSRIVSLDDALPFGLFKGQRPFGPVRDRCLARDLLTNATDYVST